MNHLHLGRLEKVQLRQVWSSESSDFTPWLAREENLALLGETIGIELELEKQEKEVGPFSADILCKNTVTDEWVLIENQLERTDHKHLGQLITYAAGLQAVTIVWIAEQFTEEHRAAMDWLNERTDDKINLFGLEIELWRIGDSSIAPKFNIISQPNEWAKTVQLVAISGSGISSHKEFQRGFWIAFRSFMEESKSGIRCQKPSPQHWMNHAIGRTGAHLASIVSLWSSESGLKDPEIRVELILDGSRSKQEYTALNNKKEEIEAALGFSLIWHNPQDKNMCRIFCRKRADFLDRSLWPEQFMWLKEKLEIMHKVLSPEVKSLVE